MRARGEPATLEESEREVRISGLKKADHGRWNDFVAEHAEATFFHLAGWETVITSAFGHPCHYLVAEQGESVVGILPLVRQKSWLFGDALISTPFCVYGGAVGIAPGVEEKLEQHACELADQLNVEYLELRNRVRRHNDWPCKSLYVTFRKSMSRDEKANLLSIPKKQRAMVRKGIQAGLLSKTGDSISNFLACYSESVRNLGTPVFSRKYFEILQRVFSDSCDILTVYRGETPVASVLSFYFRNEVLPYYGGGTIDARRVKGNDFLYWELMRRSAANGIDIFDFGRSKKDTGAYRFKKHWGFTAEPLYYEYYLVRAGSMPNLSPTNPRYRLMISVWKRLPLWVANRLGAVVSRYLG